MRLQGAAAPLARELFPQLSELRRQAGPVTGHRVTAFDVELLYLAERAGARIAEVTVAWANRDVAKGSLRRYARVAGDGRPDRAHQDEGMARRVRPSAQG